MGLREYRRKRDFTRTREPATAGKQGSGCHFVIQKHDASRLHYDLRLEMEGVLKSWAVPKGMPYEWGEKRLAVHVEDHPLDYGSFEGTIPEGEYGAGTVMVWDRGEYEADSPVQGLAKGKLRFQLHGTKLDGEWTLVRTRQEEKNWLLIKTGESIRPIGTRRDNCSAISGRTMLAIWKNSP